MILLQELIHEHRQLIEYGKAKTDAISNNNIDGLSYIATKEKRCLDRIIEHEKNRAFLVGKYMLSQKVASNQRSFKMEKLIQVVYQAEEKRQLHIAWNDLRAVIAELQDLNDFNQQLVKMTLEYLHFTQDLLLGPEDEEVTYHKAVQGMVQNRSGRVNLKL
nr:flagellar protein FlgN [Paenibacillus sp. GSMTC-2017]